VAGTGELQSAIARVLAESPDLERAAPRALTTLGEGLGWSLGVLWQVAPGDDVLRATHLWSAPRCDLTAFMEVTRRTALPVGIGLPGQVWSSGRPRWLVDLIEDDSSVRAPAAREAGLRTAVVLPVRGRRGLLGAIELFSIERRELDPVLLESLAAIGGQIGQYIDHSRTEDAVRISEASRAAMLESALDCIVAMDHEGLVVEFNPAAERTFGYRRADVVGRRLAEVMVPPALRERHRRGLAQYLATGEGPLLGRRIEVPAMRSDGSEIPVELAITPVAGSDPPLFTAYLRDITDRKLADEERARLLALEHEARLRAERAERSAAFLAEAGAVLGASLDYETTLQRVASLAVPWLADWCVVDMVQPSGSIKRMAVAHGDPGKRPDLLEIARRYPTDPSVGPIAAVVRTGSSERLSEVSDELLRELARDPEHLRLLRSVGVGCAMIVPLRVESRVIGVMALAVTGSGRRYDASDLAAAEELARRAAAAVENARVYQDRSRIAHTLQQSLLPPVLPTIPGCEVAGRYRPAGEANEVGGDFYDLFEIADSTWVFVLGDVSGKGASAAAVTALARYTIRAAAMRERGPSGMLEILNDALLSQRGPEDFCSVVCGLLELAGGEPRLTLASAGHPLPQLLRAGGEVEEVGAPGMLLGIGPDPVLEDHKVELERGDTLFLFTDGLLDAHAPEVMVSAEDLRAIVASCSGLEPAEAAERIEKAMVGEGESEVRDDIAILALRLTAPPEPADSSSAAEVVVTGALEGRPGPSQTT